MGILDTCAGVNEYFNGQGKVYLAHRASAGAIDGEWVFLGDSDSVEVTIDRSYNEHTESCSGSRNVATRVVDSTTWTFTANTFGFDKTNLARAMLGEASSVTGASVTDEAFTVFGSGTMIFTANPDISAVVITNTAGSTTLVADTDYTVDALNGAIVFTSAGLAKLTVSGSNKTGLIDYTFAAYDKVKVNTTAEQEYAVRFVGVNRVNNEAVIADIHRVKLSPASALALIGTENLSYELTGLIQADSTQGTGESQYMVIKKTK